MSSLFEKVMICLLGILGAFAVFLFIGMVFVGVDSIGTTTYRTKGKMVGKEFIKEHTTPVTTMVGKVPVTNYVTHPDTWKIYLQVNYNKVSCEVREVVYNNFEYGKEVTLEVSKGRISKTMYCKGILSGGN